MNAATLRRLDNDTMNILGYNPKPEEAKRCVIKTGDYLDVMRQIRVGTVDLVLTDPPYAISRDTGFAKVGPNGVKRFAVSKDFGKWDHQEIDLAAFVKECWKVLRKGGTAIVFYDLWKVTPLANALTAQGFTKLRLIEWLKTNPVPLNSKCTYLSNAREIAVCAVKGECKATYHGEYDKGVYEHPIPNGSGKDKRHHPTQKPVELMRELVRKHSNKDDLVIDPFLGSGTTAVAALQLGRRFKGCDMNPGYCRVARNRVKNSV